MPDILILGIGIPSKSDLVVHIYQDGKAVFYPFHGKPRKVKVLELQQHGDLISRDDLLHTMRCNLALYDSCQEDLSLADKARRDEIQNAIADIFNAPVVVPAERSGDDA